MKALILNGYLEEGKCMVPVNKFIEEILIEKGYEVESILLREKKITECMGCFDCWVKTPGICVINDYGRALVESIINSDTVIYLTPVVYGGYSSELKKAVDRIIPLMLPFFKKIEGEVHHKERYKKYPNIFVLGMMSDEDNKMKDIFYSLIKRNSLNWHGPLTGGIIEGNLEDDIKYQIGEKLRSLGVRAC
jgi:multimeric flavodoxin WrbA